jgi:hypothetical protein
LKGKHKWDVFEFPQAHVLSGLQIVFSQYDRIHVKIGSQWSEKVWEIKLDGNFLGMAGIHENLEFVEGKCKMIYDKHHSERQRPYDIMLNWLVGRPDMTSVESLQVKIAGISKTVSLEFGLAADGLTESHEGMDIEDEMSMRRSRSRSRVERVREIEEIKTTRGLLVAGHSKYVFYSCYL